MGAMPPQGGMTPPKNAMEENRSIMNPMDAAAMAQKGTIKPDMTVRELIEGVFKVPMDAPVSALTEAIKKQAANKTNMGKMGAMAQGGQPPMGQPQQPNRMPQGRPSAVPMPQGPQQGLSDLMK